MDSESNDPRSIGALAVTADDIVAALEARHQHDRPVVLRVTPPFSGRMRARLHVVDGDPEAATGGERTVGMPSPLHVAPSALVDGDAPAYPRPAETEDDLRADPNAEYTVDRHHERHRERVASWRERIRDHFVAETTLETPGGDVRVDVAVLG